jgi:hypothetical protein
MNFGASSVWLEIQTDFSKFKVYITTDNGFHKDLIDCVEQMH